MKNIFKNEENMIENIERKNIYGYGYWFSTVSTRYFVFIQFRLINFFCKLEERGKPTIFSTNSNNWSLLLVDRDKKKYVK